MARRSVRCWCQSMISFASKITGRKRSGKEHCERLLEPHSKFLLTFATGKMHQQMQLQSTQKDHIVTFVFLL